jgi:hypothetical protein
MAPMVPMNVRRWSGFSVTNASRNEAKLAYIKLNNQSPARLVALSRFTRKRLRENFHSNLSGSLSVMVATIPAM